MSSPLFVLMVGDVLEKLRELQDESIDCVVTSPPYWGLRDYGVDGQIGLEPTPSDWLTVMVQVFGEVRRVLKPEGTCWINIGDTYSDSKNLLGMPWKLAFALQDDGWILRSDVIWFKPNPMPESVRDRPTKSHEYIFLLTKQARYFYDADAVKDPTTGSSHPRGKGVNPKSRDQVYPAKKPVSGWAEGPGSHSAIDHNRTRKPKQNESFCSVIADLVDFRNKRTVWSIPTQPYKDAHFATFPDEIPRICIRAGCPIGGMVLDPFAGSGTTPAVALSLGRSAIAIELNPDYADLIKKRVSVVNQGLGI